MISVIIHLLMTILLLCGQLLLPLSLHTQIMFIIVVEKNGFFHNFLSFQQNISAIYVYIYYQRHLKFIINDPAICWNKMILSKKVEQFFQFLSQFVNPLGHSTSVI